MTKTTATNPLLLSPRKALNVAFLRVKPLRLHIETFKQNLIKLLDQINVAESEEFHKISCLNFWTLPIILPIITSTQRDQTTWLSTIGKETKSSVGVIVLPVISVCTDQLAKASFHDTYYSDFCFRKLVSVFTIA